MRNPMVSKVVRCGKNERKYIKMHKALFFLRYCLERYDCFSIYKIESGPFKFLKFCMQNTAIAYVGGHSHQLLYTIEYTMLHGRKQQLSWSFKEKINRYIQIWTPSFGRKKSMNRGATCLQLPHTDPHLPLLHAPLGLEGELCVGRLLGHSPALCLNPKSADASLKLQGGAG